MRNFAKILKEEREKMSLSQTDLGEKLNCSRYRVADLERGRITPTLEDINFLCDLFGVSADYLLGRTEIRTTDIDLREICNNTGLSENAIGRLQSYKKRYDNCLDYHKKPNPFKNESAAFAFELSSTTPIKFINALLSNFEIGDLFDEISYLIRVYKEYWPLDDGHKWPADKWEECFFKAEDYQIKTVATETMIERRFFAIVKKFAEEEAKTMLAEESNG